MPITRTVNYTQNIPENLGFGAAYINPIPDRNVRLYFSFADSLADSKMGTIIIPETPGVTKTMAEYSAAETITPIVRIEGNVNDVNIALNGAEFLNYFYEADILEQDFLSQNRELPDDYRGEMQIQINPDIVHGLSVGDFCRISSVTSPTGLSGAFLVTAIDATNSGTRIWLAFRIDYILSEKYFSGQFKNVAIGDFLQTTSSVNIAPINDLAFNNPHGTFTILAGIINADTNVTEETGTITCVGEFFIAEPEFTTLPVSSISAPSSTWYLNISGAVIEQADDNYQSVQYLIKCFENDPMYLGVESYTSLPGYPSGGTEDEKLEFIGDAIQAKAELDSPKYITDDSYGLFGVTQVNQRVSTIYDDGVVRWNFFGSPAECNEAFRRSSYFRPPNNSKDFKLETRIVNGRTRIYSTRGK